MTRHERTKYEVLLRVKDFGIKHHDRFPEGSKAGQAFARVAQAAAEIDAHGLARLQAARDGRKGKTTARATMREWMLSIARTARDVVRTGPGGDTRVQMPRRTSDVSLLASARLFLDDATVMSAALIGLGLPDNWQSEFRVAIETFEERMRGRRDGRYGVAAARAGIRTALVGGFDALRTLDVIVANTLKGDAVLLAAWERGRRIVDGKGKGGADAASPAAAAGGPVQMLDKAS